MTHFLGLGPTTKRTKARRGLFVRPEAFFVSIDKKTKRASTFRKLTKSTVQYSTVQYSTVQYSTEGVLLLLPLTFCHFVQS